MPTTAELDRLKVLSDQLASLKAAPGGPILAEHWNLFVGVVGELARALLAQNRDVLPAPHQHVDQVSLGWLEPALRTMIQGGPLSDPAAEGRLAELGRRLDRIGERSESLGGELQQLRGSLDTVATSDLVREAQLTATQRVLASQSNTTNDIQALRSTLNALRVDVATAVAAGQSMVVDGAPFDPAALTARVKAVEVLRERLKSPDGQLLDARALENRLTALTNTFATKSELGAALSQQKAGATDSAQLDGLLASVDVRLGKFSEEVTAQIVTSRNALAQDLNAQLKALRDRVTALEKPASPPTGPTPGPAGPPPAPKPGPTTPGPTTPGPTTPGPTTGPPPGPPPAPKPGPTTPGPTPGSGPVR